MGARRELTLRETLRGAIVPVYMMQLFVVGSIQSVQPVLALFALSLGASVGISAVIVAATNAVQVLLIVPFGIMAERIGRSRLLYTSSVLSIVGTAVSIVAPDVTTLILSRLLIGVAGSMYFGLAYALVADLAPLGGAGKAMSTFAAASQIGAFVGPLAGGVIAEAFGYRSAFAVATLILVPTLLAVHLIVRRTLGAEPHIEGERRTPETNVPPFEKRNYGMGLITAFQYGAGSSIAALLIPVYLVDKLHTTDVQGIGLMLGASSIGQVLVRLFAASASDRYGRKPIMSSGLILIALGAGVPLVRTDFFAGVVATMLYGVGLSLVMPATGALMADSIPRQRRVVGMAAFQTAASSGAASGPVLLGFLAENAGFPTAFVAVVASNVVVALLVTLLVQAKKARQSLTSRRPPRTSIQKDPPERSG